MRQSTPLKNDDTPEAVVRASIDALNHHVSQGLIYASHWKKTGNKIRIVLYARQRLSGFRYPKKFGDYDVEMQFDKTDGKGKMPLDDAARLMTKTYMGDRNIIKIEAGRRALVVYVRKKVSFPEKFCRWPVQVVRGMFIPEENKK